MVKKEVFMIFALIIAATLVLADNSTINQTNQTDQIASSNQFS